MTSQPGTTPPPAAPTAQAVPTAPDDHLPDDLPEQMRVRREKRARLLETGREPYPVNFARTATLAARPLPYLSVGAAIHLMEKPDIPEILRRVQERIDTAEPGSLASVMHHRPEPDAAAAPDESGDDEFSVDLSDVPSTEPTTRS